jgi:hypothetical protein
MGGVGGTLFYRQLGNGLQPGSLKSENIAKIRNFIAVSFLRTERFYVWLSSSQRLVDNIPISFQSGRHTTIGKSFLRSPGPPAIS